MLKKIGSIFIILIALVFAGELNFNASVNQTTAGADETFVLTVSVSGENIGSVPTPQLPDLPDFIVSGRSSSQSTNIQIVNGQITKQQTISYVYTLKAKSVGEYTIGPCTLVFNGETYQTNPIQITVVKGSTQTPRSPSPTGPTISPPSVAIDDDIKLVATANRRSVYVGEQITTDFAFYTRIRLADAGVTERPTFSGFWVEPIFDAQRFEFQRKVINGKAYDVSLLKKVALFPMNSGAQKISAMKMEISIFESPRDIFDFFPKTKVVPIASEPIIIDVKPLPDEDKPAEFTGGVGQFTISGALDQTVSEAAEPIYFTIRISGTGNIKLIEKPSLPLIPGIRMLDPEIKDNISTLHDLISGYKEFRYPLIPQRDGEHVIPEIKIAYFNPQDKKYHLLATEKLSFTASRTEAAAQEVQSDGFKILGTDIKYIKANQTNLEHQNASMDWRLGIFYFVSIIAISSAFVYKKHQTRMLTDRAYARKLRANRTVKKQLKQAEKHLKNNKFNLFFDTLARALLSYLGDRFNLDTRALTKEQLIDNLRHLKVNDDLLIMIKTVLNQCDMIRFSPGSVCDDPEELLTETKKIVSEI